MKVGILGGGQLARMLSLAAAPLDIQTLCIDPTPNVCANDVTQVIQAEYTDADALTMLCNQVDVLTFENENIPIAIAEKINTQKKLFPPPEILQFAQDRLFEKQCFERLEIPTVNYSNCQSLADLKEAVKMIHFPAVLKTRRFGYDGKGQIIIKTGDDIEHAWEALQSEALILEEFIQFNCEVSIIAVRSQTGDVAFYPLTQNEHRQGILRVSKAPYKDRHLQSLAEDYAKRILDHFNYVGILAIEFFVCGNQLLANEMAPRVHNSGHWTIEGAKTSQFENHIRAITGLPLGDTAPIGHSVLFNCIGNMPSQKTVQAIPNAYIHDYHKDARLNRKVGHITLNTGENAVESIEYQKLLTLTN